MHVDVAGAIAIPARSATCGSSTPRPASVREIDVTPRLAAAYVAGVGRARRASSSEFCGRYDIGYVRADAERPFEEIVLKAFRQGRFLA